MLLQLRTADELVQVECEIPRAGRLLAATAAGTLLTQAGSPTVRVFIERQSEPFATAGWSTLTRDAWTSGTDVVMHDACGSGFDLLVRPEGGVLTVIARWRPPARTRLAAMALPGRAQLLARAVLLQYPAIWWASRRGLAPLHAPACTTSPGPCVMLAGPGGVGKSTLILAELGQGGTATSDNLTVSDGTAVHGVVEPGKIEGGSGARRPYGRRETRLDGRSDVLFPDELWVVRRTGQTPSLLPLDAPAAARELIAGTYMAGELRRYWGFAAALALGTGQGPAHPPIAQVATSLAERLPCRLLTLGMVRPPGGPALSSYLGQLVDSGTGHV